MTKKEDTLKTTHKMILAVLIINTQGKLRLSRFFTSDFSVDQQQVLVAETNELLQKRTDQVCNFLEATAAWGPSAKLVYRHFATLRFVFVVDKSESELAILDLIQVRPWPVWRVGETRFEVHPRESTAQSRRPPRRAPD